MTVSGPRLGGVSRTQPRRQIQRDGWDQAPDADPPLEPGERRQGGHRPDEHRQNVHVVRLIQRGQRRRDGVRRMRHQEAPAQSFDLAGEEADGGDGDDHAAEQEKRDQVGAVQPPRAHRHVARAGAEALAPRFAGEHRAQHEAGQEDELLGAVGQPPGAVDQPRADPGARRVAGENGQLQPAADDVHPGIPRRARDCPGIRPKRGRRVTTGRGSANWGARGGLGAGNVGHVGPSE